MMLLSVKKKMAEKEIFQWTTFIKREQMRVFIRLAQNYGSTNEKLGFFCGVNYFAPYVPLLTLELFLINILPFHYSRQWGNLIYFSKTVNLSLSRFLYQCFTYILLLSFHWIIIYNF